MARIVVNADNVKDISQALHISAMEYSKIEVDTDAELLFLGCALGGETGELLNQIKKVCRMPTSNIPEDRLKKIVSEIGDVVAYLEHICDAFDLDPWECFVNKTSELVNERRPDWALSAISALEGSVTIKLGENS